MAGAIILPASIPGGPFQVGGIFSGGGGGYTAQGVNFSATTTMHRAAALTGVTDSKVGTLSFWFRGAAASDASTVRVFGANGNGGVIIDRLSSGVMRIITGDSVGSNNMILASTSSFASSAGWKNCLASWNLAAGGGHMYIEDALEGSITGTNSTIAYATGQSDYFMPDAGLPGPFDIADFWFDPNQAPLDFSVTGNRRLFITAGLAPVNLGTNGATPTGTSPAVFFSGATASWNTNKGTGGGFTISAGSITSASSNPP